MIIVLVSYLSSAFIVANSLPAYKHVFGLNDVHVLPLGILGGLYWPLLTSVFFLCSLSGHVTFSPEGVVLGF